MGNLAPARQSSTRPRASARPRPSLRVRPCARARTHVRERASARHAAAPGVYTPAARHVHTGATGLLPVATGIGFFSARVRRYRAARRGQCRQRGETPANRKKTGNAGKRRRTRCGARSARPRSRPLALPCAQGRERTRKTGAKRRAIIWHLAALCLSLLYINQAARGGSPPLDSRTAPSLAFIPPSRRRAERGAVLKAHKSFFIRNIVFVVYSDWM